MTVSGLAQVILIMLLLHHKSHSWSIASRNFHAFRRLSTVTCQVTSDHSDHTIHIEANDGLPTVEKVIADNLKHPWHESESLLIEEKQLSPRNLLRIGAVWYMSATKVSKSHVGQKPQRLSFQNATMQLNKGDYLRVHHTPRRFPNVYKYKWTGWKADPGGLVVDRGIGFWVIDKPANLPVHPTVDNVVENVAEQIRRELPPGAYVSTPQRLDQNTSGLFVVAMSRVFANYYATLLRTKTDDLLNADEHEGSTVSIHKGYKCLLCLITKEGSSIAKMHQQLKSFAILQHFLEPSLKAPKNFARTQVDETWAKSLLRVTHVGEPFPLSGSHAALELCSSLWASLEAVPPNCVGVVEVHVELLTGRTHQIRGQFKAEGFPLVGDAQYGGAIPAKFDPCSPGHEQYGDSERLALRCTNLKFLDPDVITKEDGTEDMQQSSRWNEYCLEDSWWAPFLERYKLVAAV